MGRISEVNVGMNNVLTYKGSVGTFTDDDVNKPVKLSASDTVALCADGDQIYGFIDSVERRTEDGKSVLGIQIDGRKWVTMSGTYAVGDLVEAAANEAVATALTTTWGVCSTHTHATATKKLWMVIYGAGTDGSAALIEKQ